MNASAEPPKLWDKLNAEERVAAVRHAAQMGLSQNKIAERLGVAPSTIRLCARQHTIKINGLAAWFSLSESEQLAAFKEAVTRTRGFAELGEVLGIKRDATRKFALKHNIAVQSGRGANLASINRPGRVRKSRKSPGSSPRVAETSQTVTTQDPPVSHRTAPQPSRRPSPDTPTRVHVTAHRTGQCRFPLWPDAGRTPLSGMFYCGAPVEEEKTSYCTDCRKIIKRGEVRREDQEALMLHMARMQRAKTRGKTGGAWVTPGNRGVKL
jgi:transposase-like protein